MRYPVLFIALLICCGCSNAQVPGCTDPLATNYNTQATVNDGSCQYPAATLSPYQSTVLDVSLIPETSGLIGYDGRIWTHNDDTNDTLYALDTANAQVVRKLAVTGVHNTDWEEITQNDNFIFIGDFGNNANGNRQDLHILRIPKSAMNGTSVTPDTIWFQYADQPTPTPTGGNNTDFDCEAFVAANDSLYLFSKQWVSKKTRLYAIPAVPGTYTAVVKAEYDVQGMITGATWLPARQVIGLTGYNIGVGGLTPFLYLLYDFSGTDFFGGNKRKFSLNVPQHQVEGITSFDGRSFYISNESYGLLNISAKLHKLDLNQYLDSYYRSLRIGKTLEPEKIKISPNPTSGQLHLQLSAPGPAQAIVTIKDAGGRTIIDGKHRLSPGENKITLRMPRVAAGTYQLTIQANGETAHQQFVYTPE